MREQLTPSHAFGRVDIEANGQLRGSASSGNARRSMFGHLGRSHLVDQADR